MPLLVAPLVTFALGMLLGLRRAGSLGARGTAIAGRCVAWLAALGVFPVLAFSALYRPAWAYLHVLDRADVPSFATLLFAAGSSALVVVGHRVGRTLGTLPRGDGRGPSLGSIAAAIPLVFTFVVLLAMSDRFFVLEPARKAAEAVPLWGSRFATGLMLLDALLAGGVFLTVRALDDLVDAEIDREERLGRTLPRLAASRRPQARSVRT